MSLDKLVNFIIEAAKREENYRKPLTLNCFKFERTAEQLIGAATNKGIHHREREKHYTTVLESAEKELREKGVTVEVWSPEMGGNLPYSIASGNIGNSTAQFQPKIDNKLLDAVKHAKMKMLEHREKAEHYEKHAKAFACSPQTKVELSVEDAHWLGLEK